MRIFEKLELSLSWHVCHLFTDRGSDIENYLYVKLTVVTVVYGMGLLEGVCRDSGAQECDRIPGGGKGSGEKLLEKRWNTGAARLRIIWTPFCRRLLRSQTRPTPANLSIL